jgi:hypothetical protein
LKKSHTAGFNRISGWPRRASAIEVNKNGEGEEEEAPMRNSLFREIRESEELGEGFYSKDEAIPPST